MRAGSEGSRISGVGGNESGPGSSSGGDLDPDIIGFGTGGGVAASGKIRQPPGPDDATGTSRDFASGPPAEAKTRTPPCTPSKVQPCNMATKRPPPKARMRHRTPKATMMRLPGKSAVMRRVGGMMRAGETLPTQH